MNTNPQRYDPCRERLNKITTWKLFGSLTTKKPVTEAKRVEIFCRTIRLLERRLKLTVGELRWVLKQEGNFNDTLCHLHFLLDGSNLPNKDSVKLADAFGNLWVKAGGGNHDIAAHKIERDRHGFQRAVNYITKIEDFPLPFSMYFDAGDKCHLKFSEALDKHLAVACIADQNKPTERTKMNDRPKEDKTPSANERAERIDRLAKPIIDAARKRETERRQHNEREMEKLRRLLAGDPDAPSSETQKNTP